MRSLWKKLSKPVMLKIPYKKLLVIHAEIEFDMNGPMVNSNNTEFCLPSIRSLTPAKIERLINTLMDMVHRGMCDGDWLEDSRDEMRDYVRESAKFCALARQVEAFWEGVALAEKRYGNFSSHHI